MGLGHLILRISSAHNPDLPSNFFLQFQPLFRKPNWGEYSKYDDRGGHLPIYLSELCKIVPLRSKFWQINGRVLSLTDLLAIYSNTACVINSWDGPEQIKDTFQTHIRRHFTLDVVLFDHICILRMDKLIPNIRIEPELELKLQLLYGVQFDWFVYYLVQNFWLYWAWW